MFALGEMQSTASGFFSAYASLAATMMLFRSMASDIIPPQFMSYLTQFFNYIFHYFFPPLSSPSNIVTITIDELTGMTPNQIFESAEIYLGTKVSPDAQRFKVSKTPRQNKINVTIQRNEEVNDSFQNIPQLTWLFASDAPDSDKMSPEKNYFELSFNKKYKEEVVNEYLPFVIEQAKEIKGKDRAIRLYTRGCSTYDDDDNSYGSWGSIKLEHPSTFDTLAMEPDMKKAVIDDIERFLRRKDFYKKVGKAWKRGYLLYGPPGTGKSSLVAAMANYLKFDIYDVELSSLYSNSELRDILVSTKNRSIIVIEDIDCSVETHDRSLGYHEPNDDKKFTLSGLLNFIDGLWSSCGDEKIIVFTTNHKDKLDPALLRPGRMDMHIHMSYCTFNSFKTLAFNYLGINDYPKLFAEIKELIENVQITPAEIAEELMRSEIAEDALQGVVNLLLLKQKTIEAKADAEAAKAKVNQVDDAKSETPEANVDEEEEDLDEFEKWK